MCFPIDAASSDGELLCYLDSDWCGDVMDRRSTTGYLFIFQGAQISCGSKTQQLVALSSCEAECIDGAVAAYQTTWVESVLKELKIDFEKPMKLLIANKSAISLYTVEASTFTQNSIF